MPPSPYSVATLATRPLSHLRFPEERSRGRRYPEISHPFRNPFHRDRDRIVHSRAFRRLEDKTQVFGAGYSDHFRNRLTHTIEVSQLARTVATALGLNEDLTEALALSHDVGHPPFAHAGEEELDRQMSRFGESFDHNLHTLRVVEGFEQRYASFDGLNLTFEVREGIVKHSRELAADAPPELAEYLPGLKPPLESQLIDLADEVAYNTADMDDAFDAGLVTLAEIAGVDAAIGTLVETVDSHYPGSSERVRFFELLRRLVDLLVTGLINGTQERARAAGVASFDDVRTLDGRLAAFTAEASGVNAALKRFLHARVYESEWLVAERTRSRAAIASLFQFLLDHPDRLPAGYLDDARPVHRAVCDYIAGMTDGYFSRVAAELL